MQKRIFNTSLTDAKCILTENLNSSNSDSENAKKKRMNVDACVPYLITEILKYTRIILSRDNYFAQALYVHFYARDENRIEFSFTESVVDRV